MWMCIFSAHDVLFALSEPVTYSARHDGCYIELFFYSSNEFIQVAWLHFSSIGINVCLVLPFVFF